MTVMANYAMMKCLVVMYTTVVTLICSVTVGMVMWMVMVIQVVTVMWTVVDGDGDTGGDGDVDGDGNVDGEVDHVSSDGDAFSDDDVFSDVSDDAGDDNDVGGDSDMSIEDDDGTGGDDDTSANGMPDDPNKSKKKDSFMSNKIYSGSQVTVLEAYCLLMELKRTCRLSFTTMVMLLSLLQILCPAGNLLPTSKHQLLKFAYQFKSKHSRIDYCRSCGNELESSLSKGRT